MRIFISFNGNEGGPFTIEEVKEKIYRGEIIESQTIGIYENGEHWVPLKSLLHSELPTLSLNSERSAFSSETSASSKPAKQRISLKARYSLGLMVLGIFTLQKGPIALLFFIASLALGLWGRRDIKKSHGTLSGLSYINASIGIFIVLLIIFISVFCNSIFNKNSNPKNSFSQIQQATLKIPNTGSASASQTPPPLSAKDIFNKCSPLIVSVEAFDRCGFLSKTGSGVILGKAKGKFVTPDDRNTEGTDIITNFHVIDNSYLVLVKTKDGKIRYAQILAFDRSIDLALIRIHGLFTDQDTPLAHTVGIGDPTIAIGNPEGLDQSISTGIISHLPDNKNFLVQTTAPISHGSSGGGLFNQNGDLIGITSSTLETGQNLNFAIWLQGALLQAVQDARMYEGHVWNDTQASWLKIPYTYGKYPFERFFKKSDYPSALDPDEDSITIQRPLSPFKTMDDIKKYVEDNSIDPKFKKYSTSKRNILNEVNKYNDMRSKILQNDSLDSEKALKIDDELLAFRDKQLLPAISAFYSEFPYDESIAAMYVKYVQDPTTKENLLQQCQDRWPYSIGPYSSNWLYKYIKQLVDLGKVQKVHDVLSEFTFYILQKPKDYTSDDDQTNGVLVLFKSYTECNRIPIQKDFYQYIKRFPESLKGISFKDIKNKFIENVNANK